MAAYTQLRGCGVTQRRAASLTGVSRPTANRKPTPPRDWEPVMPPNKLSPAERAEILAAVNSPDFVDLAPQQVYAKLLDVGLYWALCQRCTG